MIRKRERKRQREDHNIIAYHSRCRYCQAVATVSLTTQAKSRTRCLATLVSANHTTTQVELALETTIVFHLAVDQLPPQHELGAAHGNGSELATEPEARVGTVGIPCPTHTSLKGVATRLVRHVATSALTLATFVMGFTCVLVTLIFVEGFTAKTTHIYLSGSVMKKVLQIWSVRTTVPMESGKQKIFLLDEGSAFYTLHNIIQFYTRLQTILQKAIKTSLLSQLTWLLLLQLSIGWTEDGLTSGIDHSSRDFVHQFVHNDSHVATNGRAVLLQQRCQATKTLPGLLVGAQVLQYRD